LENTQIELTENLENKETETVGGAINTDELDVEKVEDSIEKLKADIAVRDAKLADLEEKANQAEELSFNMLLQQENLQGFADVFKTSDKNEQLEAIKVAVNQLLMDNTYVPTEKTKEDVYTSAIEQKDVQGAIKSKFAKIFG